MLTAHPIFKCKSTVSAIFAVRAINHLVIVSITFNPISDAIMPEMMQGSTPTHFDMLRECYLDWEIYFDLLTNLWG
ncbi:MAG: hypothetical protein ABFC71_07225 [Methanoregula sp.]